ncbi:MAG: hypothetical protein QF864_13250 [SAR202 cluster bacterium]|nr:hypothetical protein [SAR202 cluster bacterium]
MRFFLTSLLTVVFNLQLIAQGCCSGGAGSPIAGGAATGVLQENQMEISVNYQYNKSNKFFTESKDTVGSFDNFNSDYLFLRADYGLSKRLTMSIASGYFLNKSQVMDPELDALTISSKGFSDLILFPRYDIYNKTKNGIRTEITLGLGLKIPLGSHTDSTETVPDVWDVSPPITQLSTGSQDLMFYSFFFKDYQKQKLRIFVNSLYIRKGYNSLGLRFGDYSSIGIFASKSIYRKWGIIGQIKGEMIQEMELGKVFDDVEDWIVDEWRVKQNYTGSKKLFFIPQISYSQNGITVFATSEIPLYQHLNGTQVGSQHQFTIGINYRFLTKECESEILPLPK